MHAIVALTGIICGLASAAKISSINGIHFQSPYASKNVRDTVGLVTATSSRGLWLRSTEPDDDDRTSESIFVYSSSIGANYSVGDIISLSGTVTEYRSSADYLYITEINNPSAIKRTSSGNPVIPLLLGTNTSGIIGDKDLSPPTVQYSSLDNGDVFGLPYNTSQVSDRNPILKPGQYGLDFWESLSGELVTIGQPTVLDRPNNFGETWVYGNWTVSGKNSRGGLTVTSEDGNPEALIVGSPLDGTKNPRNVKLADSLQDVTGIIYYQYGFYYILPLTAIQVKASASPATPPVTSLSGSGTCDALPFGDYNCDNLAYNTKHLPGIAKHIVQYLKSPAIMFLQEIQDDSGPTDNGIVDANKTLDTLTASISSQGGPAYNYTYISPVNDKDGGQPGGNIRNAYLFDAARAYLAFTHPGNSTEANEVVTSSSGSVSLKYNPGLIDPTNTAFTSSRKPVVAQWVTADGKGSFFTINVQFTAKLGSTSLEGNERPPVNQGVDYRNQQANVTGSFAAAILDADPNANVIIAGDFNEYEYVEPVETLKRVSGLQNANDVAGIDPVERYTYIYQQNSQEIDQVFVSKHIADRELDVEHVHVNTWAAAADVVSDHDPSVFLLNVCN